MEYTSSPLTNVEITNNPTIYTRNYIWNPEELAWTPQQATTDNTSANVFVTNIPGSQTIDGTVSVDNFPGTQPVSIATMPSTPVTGTFWQDTQPVSLTTMPNTPVTQASAWAVEVSGTTNISGTITANQAVSILPGFTVMQASATSNSNGTPLVVTGYSNALLDVVQNAAWGEDTFIYFEVTPDGSTWDPIIGHEIGTTNTGTYTKSSGDWRFNITGYQQIRARIANYSSGTISVNGYVSVFSGNSGHMTVSQDMPGNVKTPWLVGGTNQALLQDSFNRLQVATPHTIFASKEDFQEQALLWSTLVSSGGAINYTNSTSSHALTVNTTNGSRAVRQSKNYMIYSPGKGAQAVLTGVMGTGQTNTVKRMGIFDDSNSLFFELNGTTKYVVIRNNGVDTKVPQSSWNLDDMDGQGGSENPSGFKIDWAKAQIFNITFQWLGVGRVIFAFNIDGIDCSCHQLLNANNLTSVYMQTPALPIRYEIINTGTASGSSTLTQICSTLLSSSDIDPFGNRFSCGTGTSASVVNGLIPVVMMRVKSTILHPSFIINSIDLLTNSGGNLYWQVVINPTLTGGTSPSFNSVNSNSCFEFDLACTSAVSGGQVITQGFISNQNKQISTSLSSDTNLFGTDINGNRDILCLAAATIGGGNSNTYGAINWLEIP